MDVAFLRNPTMSHTRQAFYPVQIWKRRTPRQH